MREGDYGGRLMGEEGREGGEEGGPRTAELLDMVLGLLVADEVFGGS